MINVIWTMQTTERRYETTILLLAMVDVGIMIGLGCLVMDANCRGTTQKHFLELFSTFLQ